MQLGRPWPRFLEMCDTSNLLFFLFAEERRAFLKWLWGLVFHVRTVNFLRNVTRRGKTIISREHSVWRKQLDSRKPHSDWNSVCWKVTYSATSGFWVWRFLVIFAPKVKRLNFSLKPTLYTVIEICDNMIVIIGIWRSLYGATLWCETFSTLLVELAFDYYAGHIHSGICMKHRPGAAATCLSVCLSVCLALASQILKRTHQGQQPTLPAHVSARLYVGQHALVWCRLMRSIQIGLF